MSGIYSLISAGKINERKVENSANNLANVDTVGYKEDQLSFREILSTASRVPPESDEELFLTHEYLDMYVGMDKSAVMVDEVAKNFEPGTLKRSGNPLDIAIESEGFFSVSTPQGERYTRAGQFTLDKKNQITNQDGYALLGEKGPIVAKGNNIIIDEDGGINVDGQLVDKLKTVLFKRPERLQKLGRSYFAPIDNDNVPISSKKIKVRQGMVEKSNVNTVKEMTRMIDANRAYESVQKALSHIDTMNEQAISITKV